MAQSTATAILVRVSLSLSFSSPLRSVIHTIFPVKNSQRNSHIKWSIYSRILLWCWCAPSAVDSSYVLTLDLMNEKQLPLCAFVAFCNGIALSRCVVRALAVTAWLVGWVEWKSVDRIGYALQVQEKSLPRADVHMTICSALSICRHVPCIMP